MRQGDILILDEPTAAIDAAAEQEILARFRDLNRGRACVLITHRFSTVRMADRIAVLHQARLVELGTHDELLARGGHHARMFHAQARGYGFPEAAWGGPFPRRSAGKSFRAPRFPGAMPRNSSAPAGRAR